MTEPLLAYNTPAPLRQTRLFILTWVYVLILGILACCLGTCLGGSVLMMPILSRTPRPEPRLFLTVLGVAYLLLGCGAGTIYIWSALRLRRGSRPAATIAMALAFGVAGLVSLLMMTVVIIGLVRHVAASNLVALIFAVFFYMGIVVANATAAYLLFQLRRLMPESLPI